MLTQNEMARLTRTVAAMRDHGGPARAIAASKLDGVVHSIGRELTDGFLTSEVEAKFRDLLQNFPSVMEEYAGSPEARRQRDAERAANPTRDDYARMSASDRLEAINAREHAEREAQAAKDAKLKTDEFSPAELRALSPARRLEISNELARFGAQEPEPKKLSPEQVRRLDAARRLDHVNQQIEASRKNSAALAKRLKAAKEKAE